MKYESCITNNSKAMANVKDFADKQTNIWTNGQTDRPKTICHQSIDEGA